MKIIAGLGNPGPRYSLTRHNCGFLTLDILAGLLEVKIEKKEQDSLTAQANYKGQKLFLLKPQSFMNLSGFPLIRAANYYKIPLENILIIFDDMSLPCGSLRLRADGGSGGHNGINSIIEQAGTNKINRLKIGIGPSVYPDSADYVLAPFTEEEMPLMAEAFKKAAEAALFWAEKGIEEAMNKYNTKNGILE